MGPGPVECDLLSQKRFDAVIVLGGGVEGNGLSSASRARLRTAVDLLTMGVANKLVIVGNSEEAMRMLEHTLSLGVEGENVLVDRDSKTTIGNAYYSKLIALRHGFKRLVIVTSEYHIRRALEVFKHVFGDEYEICGYPSHDEAPGELAKREDVLRVLMNLFLATFEKGSHERIMELARRLGVE